MTERDWLERNDIVAMLRHVGARYTLRHARLFAVACCRDCEPLVRLGDDRIWQSLLTLEYQADGDQPVDVSVRRWTEAYLTESINADYFSPERFAAIAVRQLLRITRHSGASNVTPSNAMWPLQLATDGTTVLLNGLHNRAEFAYLESKADLLRDIVGNPFAHQTIEPAWRTTNVLALATMIHDWHAYENMPILGDALMDAGCDDDHMIQHCQRHEKHVRGCWLIDALLGQGQDAG